MMTRISVLLLTCLPLAAAFTSPASFAGAGQRSGLQSATSPASRLHNVALRAPKAATGVSALNMKVPKIIQGGMGVQVGQLPLSKITSFFTLLPPHAPLHPGLRLGHGRTGSAHRALHGSEKAAAPRASRHVFSQPFFRRGRGGISGGVIKGGTDPADFGARL